MRCYENRSTIMTSNRPLEEWGKLLCDVPTAGAILDRFLHHAQVIAITGKGYRVKEDPASQGKTKSSGSPTNLRPPGPRAKARPLAPARFSSLHTAGFCFEETNHQSYNWLLGHVEQV